MYLWPEPDFQQVRQVEMKASNQEVDMLTDPEEDVSQCEHWACLGFFLFLNLSSMLGFMSKKCFYTHIMHFSKCLLREDK